MAGDPTPDVRGSEHASERARNLASSASDEEVAARMLRGLRLHVQPILHNLFLGDENLRINTEHNIESYFAFCALHMMDKQPAIAKRIEQSSDDTTRLTKSIKVLTTAAVVVAIPTLLSTVIQVAIAISD